MANTFKKGDKVKVWSLQSFVGGGFLNGAPAVVRQSQIGDSVILAVVRNFDGGFKLDKSYEVYARQCIPEYLDNIKSDSYLVAMNELEEYRKAIINDISIP